MKISGIILSKNSEATIKSAIESLNSLADEIIVLDGDSTDNTSEIARKAGARVVTQKKGGYSVWRTQGIEEAKGDWLFYLDSDERLSNEISLEISQIIKSNGFSFFASPRKNIILGRVMTHGGWWPDYVKRLFLKKDLIRWEKDLHEEPVVHGKMGYLKNSIIHYKHDNLTEMVIKTNKWSDIEAKLLQESNHPQMSWWRFFRIMLTELSFRLIRLKGFLDGPEGVIYSLYQMWSKFITYAKLWEIQITKS